MSKPTFRERALLLAIQCNHGRWLAGDRASTPFAVCVDCVAAELARLEAPTDPGEERDASRETRSGGEAPR